MHEFIFVLGSEEVTLQGKHKIKKAYRQEGIETNCIYHGRQLFKMPWSYSNGDHLTVCIDFKRQYFIEMIQWVEKIRGIGFAGDILLSFTPNDFDYDVIPKFLACGGSYIVERTAWVSNPILLTSHKHDERVLEWLHNKAYERTCDLDNDEAMQHLYEELLGESSFSPNTLSYVYNGLSDKKREALITFLKEKMTGFKHGFKKPLPMKKMQKGLIAVWHHPEFACELGMQIAKQTDKTVLLVDLDRLNPTFDFYCGTGRKRKGQGNKTLNEIQRLYDLGQLTDEGIKSLCHSVRGLKSLRVVYGCHDLRKFEYFTNEAIIEALACFKRSFDVVVLNVNKFIYDAYTCLGLIKSDCILVPVDGYLTTMRDYQRSMDLLCEKQQLSMEKLNYVFFECESGSKHEIRLLTEIIKSPVIGEISRCKKRRNYRNLKKPYGLSMAKNISKEYKHLIESLIE